MSAGPLLRPVGPPDRAAALALWDACFEPARGYFRRYFEADPWYREGDCLGAWCDGRLVSAAHVCRRPVRWGARLLLCGAVANVATLPEYRRRGLSRALLEGLIARMEAEGFDYSLLFTGAYGHYAPLGWEQVPRPQPILRLAPDLPPSPPGLVAEPAEAGPLVALYADLPPRALRTERPDPYFRGWVEWNWRQWGAGLLRAPEGGGFAVVGPAERASEGFALFELHARDAETEAALLRAAAAAARAAGHGALTLAAPPAWAGIPAALGTVETRERGHLMLRSVRLAPHDLAEVRRLYASGEAAWWPAEAF